MDDGYENDIESVEDQFEDDFDSYGPAEETTESAPSANPLNDKLNAVFEGKVVRKDLTKKIKEGANVPVYVLEYLLGMYCATQEEEAIAEGVKTVKKILAENFVRPDEAQKVISKLRERGMYTVIDKISVKLNYKEDRYCLLYTSDAADE